MQRRDVLVVTGSAVTATLTGCQTSSGGSTPTDAPDPTEWDGGTDTPGESAPNSFGIELDNASVAAGAARTVELTVTNTGEVPLIGITATLSADSPITTVNDEVFVSGLAPGESTTMYFTVRADRSALGKTYPLSLAFQYHEADDDSVVSETYRIGIDVEATERTPES